VVAGCAALILTSLASALLETGRVSLLSTVVGSFVMFAVTAVVLYKAAVAVAAAILAMLLGSRFGRAAPTRQQLTESSQAS
jgi:hypothetical protein